MPLLRSKNGNNTTGDGDGVNRHQLMYANSPAMMANRQVNHENDAASGRDAALIGAAGPLHQGNKNDAGIQAADAVSHGQSTPKTSRRGTGQGLTGKVESALGSMVGSNALKAKGLQKEQEANSTSKLHDTEHQEHEPALMRRERVLAHSAHPSNSALAAGRAGTGISGPAGPDVGF